MAKTDPAGALMKRLQRIEEAHARLVDVGSRLRTQADAIGELVRASEAAARHGANGTGPGGTTPRRRSRSSS